MENSLQFQNIEMLDDIHSSISSLFWKPGLDITVFFLPLPNYFLFATFICYWLTKSKVLFPFESFSLFLSTSIQFICYLFFCSCLFGKVEMGINPSSPAFNFSKGVVNAVVGGFLCSGVSGLPLIAAALPRPGNLQSPGHWWVSFRRLWVSSR